MSTVKIGIQPWGTAPKQNKNYGNDDVPRIPFVKFKKGLNDVRIITGIGSYYQARYKGPQARNKVVGDRVRTAYPTYDDCPVVNDLGLKAKERYAVLVIDRSDNEIKIMDMSVLIKDDVEDAIRAKNSRRPDGDKVTPRDFDVSIKFNPDSDSVTGWYGAAAHDTAPLSAEDLALIEDIGGDDMLNRILERHLICPKRETVIKKLTALGWDGKPAESSDSNDSDTDSGVEETTEADYSFQRPSDEGSKQAANA